VRMGDAVCFAAVDSCCCCCCTPPPSSPHLHNETDPIKFNSPTPNINTQGVRATTAAAAPSPEDLATALLNAASPQLPAAPLTTVTAVLSAAGRLGVMGAVGGGAERPEWWLSALQGAEVKVQAADDEVRFGWVGWVGLGWLHRVQVVLL